MNISEQVKKEMAKFQKHLNEMSPERRKAIEQAFMSSESTTTPPEPPMRQMHFGGSYCFDQNRKQVELNGDFSKEDLFRIALTMRD